MSNLPEISIVPKQRGWRLKTEMLLPQPPDEIFPFFSDAENLELLTPASLKFQILTPPPIEMKRGTLIDYRLRLHRVPIRWRTEITEWDPPFRFVDTQIKGPYRFWVHEHQFLKDDDGTRVVDRVQYDMTFGRLLHPLFIKRDLRRIFRHRAKVMRELLGSNLAMADSR